MILSYYTSYKFVFVHGDMPWVDVHFPDAVKEKKIVFTLKVLTFSVGDAGIS
jgi:hypothetical protein